MKMFNSIVLNGNAVEAAEYYNSILKGNLQLVRYKDMGMDFGDEKIGNLAARATIKGDDFYLALSDDCDFLGQPDQETSKMCVSALFETADQAKAFFDALSKDAKKIKVPFDKTPFAEGFGWILDKYSVGWEITGNILFGMDFEKWASQYKLQYSVDKAAHAVCN